MNDSEIVQHRLVNQNITTTNLLKPEEIITFLGAMQAQEFSQAKWAIGLRLPHLIEGYKDRSFHFTSKFKSIQHQPIHLITPL